MQHTSQIQIALIIILTSSVASEHASPTPSQDTSCLGGQHECMQDTLVGEAALLQRGTSRSIAGLTSTAEERPHVWDQLENMTLKDLSRALFVPPSNGSFDMFMKNAESGSACGVLWFYHIGKTGGTSVYAWLKQMQALGHIHTVLDLWAKWRWGQEIDLQSYHRDNLQPLFSKISGNVVAVHHHHYGPGLHDTEWYFSRLAKELEQKGCFLKRFTVLRGPKKRLLSNVYYDMQLMGQTPSQLSQADRNNRVRNTLSWPSGNGEFDRKYDNYQVRYTLNNFGHVRFPMPFGQDNGALNAAIKVLDRFDLVGHAEEMQKNIDKVSQWFGWPAVPVPHANVQQQSVQHHENDQFPADVMELIDQRTRVEGQLWDKYR